MPQKRGGKIKINHILPLALIVFLIFCFLGGEKAIGATAADIASQIQSKQARIDTLNQQIKNYQNSIHDSQIKALTLQNELSLIANQIAEKELKLEKTQTEIDEVNLEIENLGLSIEDKEVNINDNKKRLGALVRAIAFQDRKNYLEILLTNDSFSKFINQVSYLEQTQGSLENTLKDIQALKQQLQGQKDDAETKSAQLDSLKAQLARDESALTDQRNAKTVLLGQTAASEQKFQNLVAQLKKEQTQLNSDLTELEKQTRQRIGTGSGGVTVISWPVSPARGITAYFHDVDYPYNYIFQHPAIDIRLSQGTPVRAAGNGYVARAFNGGMKYSYVMIVHDNGLATVYGHLSKIYAQEDTYVGQGDIIGLSGGIPGTPGAGNMTTGAHLHFEVRMNGIPVDPLNYLP